MKTPHKNYIKKSLEVLILVVSKLDVVAHLRGTHHMVPTEVNVNFENW